MARMLSQAYIPLAPDPEASMKRPLRGSRVCGTPPALDAVEVTEQACMQPCAPWFKVLFKATTM